jgi:hypothetical protein
MWGSAVVARRVVQVPGCFSQYNGDQVMDGMALAWISVKDGEASSPAVQPTQPPM